MNIANYDIIMLEFEDNLRKRIERQKYEYSVIRAGRANPKMLDKVYADYYGTPTPIHQMANINVPEARTITITPWDMSQVKEVVKAIQASDLGVTPTDDGRIIRLNFPAPTEERRKELIKDIREYCEDAKIGIRKDRQDTLAQLKKDGAKVSEDDVKSAEAEVQKLVDKFNASADAECAQKEKDILEI